jgi:cellulose synthase/poly-beta-1,6-N-acetylglucosamine synthase-like glycosyltransferase
MLFILFLAITSVFTLIYISLFLSFRSGWKSTAYFEAKQDFKENESTTKFSIIIPARNEENNIKDCLLDIILQNYPSQNFEIIVVDDFSEDETVSKIEEVISTYPEINISLIKLSEILPEKINSFKKFALKKAIEKSKNNWILTTDADCRRGENWLKTLAAFIEEHDPYLVSAPVSLFYDKKKIFQRMQALEFSSLIGMGAASIQNQKPNMCNGANLAYRKDIFYEVGGFEGIDDIASGDDELLMHRIFKKYPGKVKFLKNKEAIVFSHPAKKIKTFIQQRKRWVSKGAKYEDKSISGMMLLAYLFNFGLFSTGLLSFWDLKYFYLFIGMLAVKLFVEWPFFREMTSFFGQESLRKVFIPASLIHIPYSVFIGIYGNFGKYNWKGRKVS